MLWAALRWNVAAEHEFALIDALLRKQEKLFLQSLSRSISVAIVCEDLSQISHDL